MTRIGTASIVAQSSPGTMIYEQFQVEDQGEVWEETGLLIREDMQHIKALPRHPVIEVRAGMLNEGNVQLLAILVKVQGELYETWFNYHQRGEDSEKCLNDWIEQEDLAVIFFSDTGLERSIRIRNLLSDLAQRALPLLRQAEPWTMEDFDAARARLYERYPTVGDLWKALGGISS